MIRYWDYLQTNLFLLSDDEDDEDPSFYQPKFNLDRFQQFLANEEKNHTISTISGQAQMSHLDQGPIQSTQIQLDSMQNTRGMA